MSGARSIIQWLAAVLLPLAGCTGTITGAGDDDGAGDAVGGSPGDGDGGGDGSEPIVVDPDAPRIEIDAPQRGTILDGDTVVVSGRVTAVDSAVRTVTVNGRDAEIGGDGSFAVSLTVPPGIAMIQTIARSVDGRRSTDMRAVLGGTLVPAATAVAAGVTAHLGPRAISGFAGMVSDVANRANLTAMATALNPIVDTGSSCNSARIYVDSISRSGIAVGAGPVAGGIDTGAHVNGLLVRGRVTFRLLCISGSTGWSIRSSYYGVRGTFRPSLSNGGIHVDLANLQSGFSGFGLSIGGVPGFITNLFAGAVRDRIAGALRDKIIQIVPPQVNALLGDFVADTWDARVLDETITTSIWPTSMSWSNVGGSIALRTSVSVAGSEGAPYLATPRPSPSAATMVSNDLRVAVADDAANQLLSALWASGALEASASASLAAQIAELGIETDFAAATVHLSLPPVATFDAATGAARLTIGDLVVETVDTSGESGQLVASAEIDVTAGTAPDGRLQVNALPPRLVYQFIGEGVTELDAGSASAIAALVTENIADQVGELLGGLPVPGLPGVTMTRVGTAPIEGYLVMGGSLSF
jgi:hypothetical protein